MSPANVVRQPQGGRGGSPTEPVSSSLGPAGRRRRSPAARSRRAGVVGAVGGHRDLAALAGERRARVGGVGRRDREALAASRSGPVPVGCSEVGRIALLGRSGCRRRRRRARRSCARRTRRASRDGRLGCGPGSVPKLMLMASAPWSAAQTIALATLRVAEVGLGDQQRQPQARAREPDAVVGRRRRPARRRACRGRRSSVVAGLPVAVEARGPGDAVGQLGVAASSTPVSMTRPSRRRPWRRPTRRGSRCGRPTTRPSCPVRSRRRSRACSAPGRWARSAGERGARPRRGRRAGRRAGAAPARAGRSPRARAHGDAGGSAGR